MECCADIEILNMKPLETENVFDVILGEIAEYKIDIACGCKCIKSLCVDKHG